MPPIYCAKLLFLAIATFSLGPSEQLVTSYGRRMISRGYGKQQSGMTAENFMSALDALDKATSSSCGMKKKTRTAAGPLNLAYQMACFQGHGMDRCEKGHVSFAVENYGYYACNCGYGGGTKWLDASDWCCYKHDRCYKLVSRKYDVGLMQMYSHKYTVTCRRRGTKCRRRNDRLGADLCSCDRKIAACLAEARKSYNPQLRGEMKEGKCGKVNPLRATAGELLTYFFLD